MGAPEGAPIVALGITLGDYMSRGATMPVPGK
jgi:hypothetical protein